MTLASLAIGTVRKVERLASYVLGKGYGGATLATEVRLSLKLLGRAPATVVDVGGNVGDWTATMLAAAPDARVHVFEPSAGNVAKLSARFGEDARIAIVPAALSDQPGEVELFADREGSGLASLSRRDLSHHGMTFDYREQVRAIRFEDYWRETLGGRAIDIMKVDVEGHELDVLRSAGDALGAVEVIQFEFGGTCIDSRTFFRDIWEVLTAYGFRIYRISPLGLYPLERYSEREEVYLISNYLAKRSAPVAGRA